MAQRLTILSRLATQRLLSVSQKDLQVRGRLRTLPIRFQTAPTPAVSVAQTRTSTRLLARRTRLASLSRTSTRTFPVLATLQKAVLNSSQSLTPQKPRIS